MVIIFTLFNLYYQVRVSIEIYGKTKTMVKTKESFVTIQNSKQYDNCINV